MLFVVLIFICKRKVKPGNYFNRQREMVQQNAKPKPLHVLRPFSVRFFAFCLFVCFFCFSERLKFKGKRFGEKDTAVAPSGFGKICFSPKLCTGFKWNLPKEYSY